MADTPSFGSGLGTLVGAEIGANDLNNGSNTVNNISSGFSNTTAPYNSFGQSFLSPATSAIGNVASTAGTTQGYNQFMSNYQTTPGVQYQMDQADAVQNNSAAAKGQVLSGANERSLSTINQGIASTGANTAYNEYLAGNNQQFGQLESSLGNMFSAIGVGTTATGQQAGVDTAQMNDQAAIAQAQAKNDSSKGSGLGSMFGGLGSLAAAF